jgi:hypothetical protein
MVGTVDMTERHTITEMSSEWLREASILVAVFGILDKFLRSETPTWGWTFSVLTVALLFFVIGCTLERWRP